MPHRYPAVGGELDEESRELEDEPKRGLAARRSS